MNGVNMVFYGKSQQMDGKWNDKWAMMVRKGMKYMSISDGKMDNSRAKQQKPLITRSSKKEIASLKDAMNHAFSMTYLGLLSQFLGLEIAQSQHGIKFHWSKYDSNFLTKFSMKYCKPRKTPFLSGVKLEKEGSSTLVNNTV